MLEEAAPLTEPPHWLAGWGSGFLASGVYFWEALGTVAACTVTMRAVTVPVACPGAGC